MGKLLLSTSRLYREFELILKKLVEEPSFRERVQNKGLVPVAAFQVEAHHFGLYLFTPSSLKPLTKAQKEVASLMGRGLRNKGIAGVLGKSEHTVANLIKVIKRKWKARSRAEVARFAALMILDD